MGGDGTCCGMIVGVCPGRCFWFFMNHGGVWSSWESGMGSSSVEDVGSEVSGCVSR